MDKKLKIGVVCMEDVRVITSWSGIPYHLLNALKKQDVVIEVFSPLKAFARYALGHYKVAARIQNKEVLSNHFPIVLRSYARQLERKIERAPVDVLLAVGNPPVTLLECSQPIVFFGDAVFKLMPGYYGGLLDRLTAGAIRRGLWQESKALDRCTIGVYASSWAAEAARKQTRPSKIRVVPFGASVPVKHDMESIRQWVTERSSRMPFRCQLLFIGVDWLRKGGAIAVETTRLLREMGVDAKLTVVGCEPLEKVDAEYVRVLGFVDKQSPEGRKTIEALYRDATFFILPTKAEAAGIVFCEASAFGVPSVTFGTGGVPEYVREGINGVCLPVGSKPQLFASKIKEIMDDREYYSALCIGGFQEYRDRLNWDSTAKALVGLCREALLDR